MGPRASMPCWSDRRGCGPRGPCERCCTQPACETRWMADLLRIHPVVLCGGSGTRLWPLSRALYPKQLLALASERTLFQDAVLRTADGDRFAPPIVVGNEEHRFLLTEQLREIGV